MSGRHIVSPGLPGETGRYPVWYKTYGDFILAALACVLMALVLYGNGGCGLSDNGDFQRVMTACGLSRAEESRGFVYQNAFWMELGEGGFLKKLFHIFPFDRRAAVYPSVHLVFVKLSMAVSLVGNRLCGLAPETYSTETLGVILLLCYGGCLLWLFRGFHLPSAGMDGIVKLLMLVILCDEGYIAYFNSLYSEPVQMLGLLVMAGGALRVSSSRPLRNALVFFSGCLLYGWSKFINLPPAALCAVGVGLLFLLRAERRCCPAVGGMMGACVLALCAVYTLVPGWMSYETNYNAVFYGAVKDASEERTAAYLEELGLPLWMEEYRDSNYYTVRGGESDGREGFRENFSKLDKTDVLWFYLRHPGWFLEKLDITMAHAGTIRPWYLSNLGEGSPRLAFAGRFSLWSWLRARLPLDTWWFSGLVIAAALVLLWREERKYGRVSALAAVVPVLGCLVYQFIMPMVSNGEGDLQKHLFAYGQLVDLLLLFLLARFGAWLWARKGASAPLYLGGAVCAMLAVLLLPGTLRPAAQSLRIYGEPEPGAYVQLGVWEEKPLLWQVTAAEDGVYTLLAAEPVAERPFDGDENLWAEADMRLWLNGEFLSSAFFPAERELIQRAEHRVLLSSAHTAWTEVGWNDFYATHITAFSDRGMDDALAMVCEDAVRLPDIGTAAELSRRGEDLGTACWMETPYYNNGQMVRILGDDGCVYMRDAWETWAVRPMVTVRDDAAFTGRGSLRKPFVPVT